MGTGSVTTRPGPLMLPVILTPPSTTTGPSSVTDPACVKLPRNVGKSVFGKVESLPTC